MISRKQQSESPSTHLGPAAALISLVVILTVFAQPGWHMFHDLRHFCFILPNTLRCGHSHWLDLLIQLVCLDASPLPPPSLSHPYRLLTLSFEFSLKPVEEPGEVKTTPLFAQCPKQWWTGDQNGETFGMFKEDWCHAEQTEQRSDKYVVTVSHCWFNKCAHFTLEHQSKHYVLLCTTSTMRSMYY